MAVGVLLQSLAFISASFSSEIWHLYLSQGVTRGCGIVLIYIPSLPIISQWFSTKRSLANGISASGSGFGGMFFSWMTGLMLERIGLQWTLRTMGLMTLAANSFAVETIPSSPRNLHLMSASPPERSDFTSCLGISQHAWLRFPPLLIA